MSNTWNLEDLREKRGEILKAELFMLLHDVGKLQPGHQAKFIRGYEPPHFATRYKHDVHVQRHPVWNEVLLNLDCKTTLLNSEISLKDIVTKHHGAIEQKDGIWAVFSRRIDRLDSGWDRDSIISTLVQPIKEFIEIDSVFGIVKHAYKRVDNNSDIRCPRKNIPWLLIYKGPENFEEQRLDCLNRIFVTLIKSIRLSLDDKINYQFDRAVSRLAMQKACGDTRFSVNDITLWDHSISTSILYKTLISWAVGTQAKLNDKGKFPRSDDGRFQKWFHPQLLPLRIDGLAYLSQSNNIPDLLARRELLQNVYNTWQDILEWEYPLAGEVYKDENGPVFLTFLRDRDNKNTVPLTSLELPDEKSGEQKSVLPEARQRARNLQEYLQQAIVHLTQGDLTLPPTLLLYTYTQKRIADMPEAKSLGDLLREERERGLWFQADIGKVSEAWKEVKEEIEKSSGSDNRKSKFEEICSVCGLRPQGYGGWLVKGEDSLKTDWERHYWENHKPRKNPISNCQACKAISRGMCGVCLNRRVARARPWVIGAEKESQERFWEGRPETVWLDEVADKNGRIALVVGYFPLENWLDGFLVESLAMFKRNSAESEPVNRKISVLNDQGNSVDVVLGPKPVSYSRIRRVWETTRRFWQDVAPTDPPPKALQEWLSHNEDGLELKDLWEGPLSLKDSLAGQAIGESLPRIFLKGTLQGSDTLGPFHAYELEIQGRKVAVLWVPEEPRDEDGTPLDLQYKGGFWVIENLEYLDNVYGRSFHDLVTNLGGQSLQVYEPSEYGRPGKSQTTFAIQDVKYLEKNYIPLIPILAEPRTFMAIVPADKAFEVVKAIKTKYEREMGKVRNRLPLHIGIVYAYRKMPLRAILDAGRRILKQKLKEDKWEVLSPCRKLIEKKDKLPEKFNDDKDGQFKEWFEVFLKKGKRTLTWYVPAMMGDGKTEDHWYPYVFIASPTEPTNCNRYYKAENPWQSKHSWLVHAGELKKGDKIYFTPATFDFEFLDSNARRFEIAYDEKDRRRNSLTKPYLLDELVILEKIWNFLAKESKNGKSRLSSAQIFDIRNLIESKREEWFDDPEDSLKDWNFRKFCQDLFINAQWQWGEPDHTEIKWLADMAVRGYFTDAIYLFHHVMKDKPEGEKE